MKLGRLRRWTPKKRRRARKKANAALRKRRETIEDSRDRQDSEFAGLLPMLHYSEEEFELRDRFEECLDMRKGRTAVYQPEDEAMAVIGRLMAGISRREHLDELVPEMLLAEALGIPKWPSGDTERRFLVRANETTVRGVDGILRDLAIDQGLDYKPYTVHVAGDLSGLRSQARQREGVKVGYMGGPIKPGYQTMRVSVNGMPAWTDLRAGNDGCVDLPDRSLEICRQVRRKLPKSRIHLGLDSGFGNSRQLCKVQAMCQTDRQLHYFVGGSSQYAPQWWEQIVLPACKNRRWDRISKTTEILELGWQKPWGNETDRMRVVATRRKEWGKGRKRKYQIRVIYTDVSEQDRTARWVFGEYHERQRVEADIKDGKQSFRLKDLPVKELIGNRLYVKMTAIAQGMTRLYVREFERYRGPNKWGPQSKTVRRNLFKVAGEKTG